MGKAFTKSSRKTHKQLCSPFSSGGGGVRFENHVQASFVALMLTGGFAPCFPECEIIRVQLQARIAGFQTDDIIVTVEDKKLNSNEKC